MQPRTSRQAFIFLLTMGRPIFTSLIGRQITKHARKGIRDGRPPQTRGPAIQTVLEPNGVKSFAPQKGGL
jgi:hypothetical protein